MSTKIDGGAVKVPEGERVWYRHRESGDLAYLSRLDGQPILVLDRPNQQILKKVTADWVEEHSRYELLPMQRALVALEADKQLCKLFGLFQLGRRDWTMMRPAERQDWLENGPNPVGDPARDRARHTLWKMTMSVLGRLK